MKILKTIAGLQFWFGARWLPCGEHVTRYYMYRRLERIVTDTTRGAGKKVLAISHSKGLTKYLGIEKAKVVEANYPEYNATDLKAFGDGEFDYVISDKVLEHVEGNPQRVFDETLRLLKPGGIAVHTTCFVYPEHAYPSDFWRFTPAALKYLARNFSKVLEVGGFGNRAVWVVDFLGLKSAPVPHAKWHPLHIVATKNNKEWPVSTWIVAQK